MKRFALLIALAACGSVGPKFTGDVRVADSRLVPINPDVKTLADSDQPVFFSRGSYWLFNDGKWFAARTPQGPWSYDKKPPVPVRQIDQPFAFVHYKHDQAGKEIETVARGEQGTEQREPESARPAKDRQPSAVDPSVDPTLNMFPR